MKIKNLKFKIIPVLSLTSMLYALTSTPVFAALSSAPFTIDKGLFTPAAFGTVGDLATNILKILTTAVGILAIFFIMLSGFKFASAGGDEKKMESARNTITYAIIGVAVTVLAFIVLELVQYFLGSKVVIS